MSWIFPALAAPFINAIINFCDKYLITRSVADHRAMPLYTATTSFCAATAVWLGFGHPWAGGNMLWGVASGISYFAAVIAYYHLMFRKDASDTVIISGFTPVITLVLSFLFLDERITWLQFAGFWLVLAAVMIISAKPFESKGGIETKIIGIALAMDFFWAMATILIKLSMISESFALSLACEGWGLGLAGLLFYFFSPAVRHAFFNNLATTAPSTFFIIGFNELLSVAAVWVGFYAYSIGPVALVSVAGGAQSFFAIIIGYLLTTFVPWSVAEDISGGNISKKIIAVFGLMAGLYLIYV